MSSQISFSGPDVAVSPMTDTRYNALTVVKKIKEQLGKPILRQDQQRNQTGNCGGHCKKAHHHGSPGQTVDHRVHAK